MPGEEKQQGYAFGTAISTPRLILRPASEQDRLAMAALAANPHVAENLSADPSAMPGESGETFAVIEKRSGTVVGCASYGPMVERRASVEVAAWIGQPFWGRGYATEATHAVIDRAFADERINVLWCSNRASNFRARRVIEKCGFQFRETGMVRSPSLRGAMPVERFVLERRNWQSLKSWGSGNKKGGRDAHRDNAA
jgi:RimJ/RimL family protein N-acetyltransferase